MFKIHLFIFLIVCGGSGFVRICEHMWWPQRLAEGVGSPGAGGTGSYKPPSVGPRNQPWSSARAAQTLNLWVIFPAFLSLCFKGGILTEPQTHRLILAAWPTTATKAGVTGMIPPSPAFRVFGGSGLRPLCLRSRYLTEWIISVSLLFLETGSLAESGAHWLAGLVGHWTPGVHHLYPQPLGLQIGAGTAGLL